MVTQHRPTGTHVRKNIATEREREDRGGHQHLPRMDRHQSIKACEVDPNLAARANHDLAVHCPVVAKPSALMEWDSELNKREEGGASGKDEFLLFGGMTTQFLRKTVQWVSKSDLTHLRAVAENPVAQELSGLWENERSYFITISDDQLNTLRKLVWAVTDGCVAAPAPTKMFSTQRAPLPKRGASAKAKVEAKAKSQAKAKGTPVARSGGGQDKDDHRTVILQLRPH